MQSWYARGRETCIRCRLRLKHFIQLKGINEKNWVIPTMRAEKGSSRCRQRKPDTHDTAKRRLPKDDCGHHNPMSEIPRPEVGRYKI